MTSHSKVKESSLKELKELIEFEALKVKEGYERNLPTKGHLLLAMICAFWTVLTASESANGLEYLYEPHPAQVASIFLALGIV